jgi:hypothetical protein
MPRKRFNLDEREILRLGAGASVEWQNVTQWHAGRLLTSGIVVDDGWEGVWVTNLDSTAALSAGDQICVSPGHIRRSGGDS